MMYNNNLYILKKHNIYEINSIIDSIFDVVNELKNDIFYQKMAHLISHVFESKAMYQFENNSSTDMKSFIANRSFEGYKREFGDELIKWASNYFTQQSNKNVYKKEDYNFLHRQEMIDLNDIQFSLFFYPIEEGVNFLFFCKNKEYDRVKDVFSSLEIEPYEMEYSYNLANNWVDSIIKNGFYRTNYDPNFGYNFFHLMGRANIDDTVDHICSYIKNKEERCQKLVKKIVFSRNKEKIREEYENNNQFYKEGHIAMEAHSKFIKGYNKEEVNNLYNQLLPCFEEINEEKILSTRVSDNQFYQNGHIYSN